MRSKSPLRWSNTPPRRAGYHWYRKSDQHEPSIVKVYRDGGGEWSVLYGDLRDPVDEIDSSCDYVVNFPGQYAFIPEPRE